MIHDDCPTDLLAKERRNELTPLERRALQVHLSKCQSCRAWQQIGQDFDHASEDNAEALAKDAAVVQRIADRVKYASTTRGTRWGRGELVRRKRPVRWLLLAALASSAAAAAAVTGWQVARDVPPPEVDRSLTHSAPSSSEPHPTATHGATQQTDAMVSAPLPSTDSVTPSDAPAAISRAPKAPGNVAGSAETALSLYREANQARRSGEVSRAIVLFRQLQQFFPRSPEAQLSRVPLGGALLESGAARDALQQFDRYLATGGQRTLAAEALFGRARALGKLGNRAEERAAWQRLVREFPRSPYSATASRRLEALE